MSDSFIDNSRLVETLVKSDPLVDAKHARFHIDCFRVHILSTSNNFQMTFTVQ